MKIFVTGGKGVVGTRLVKELISRGYDVWTCDLIHSSEERHYRCDIRNYRQLLEIFEKNKFDYVYHLAAEFGRWNGEHYYEDLWTTNAVGTKNMIRLQEKLGFRMIFTSSSEVYGDYEEAMSEAVLDKLEIRQKNDYAVSKWVNELQILNSREMSGTETLRIRIFNTYGPGEYYTPYRSAICVFIYHALHHRPYTVYLNHTRTSVYIDDCVSGMANAVDHFQAGEVYNIGGVEEHDMKTVSDMILKCLDMDDRNVNYVQQESFTTKYKKCDISKAVRDLNYRPKVALAEGIPKTVAWMKELYSMK
ncbi:NAD-dependent epimerase/dehydratase family protein [Candidatus Formimonas warabiya]|uniref:Nucleoside-diphosphate sugar epimerase n=1 Tax=Formimonas warabiya TaxID=1761012 RepID=A0A3G1KSK7_FORW1|nr:NAD(P)-dependent oxidoreductase [Candidatus Formimonas warabiya]ATW25394.1 nucleoside-diphosphate sugar epimerase [Candidatus Formimonas warabiya]